MPLSLSARTETTVAALLLLAGLAVPVAIIRQRAAGPAAVPDRVLEPSRATALRKLVDEVAPGTTGRVLVIFTDYECPACRHLDEELAGWERQPWMGGTSVVFLNYPLPMHKGAFAKAVQVEALRSHAGFAAARRSLMEASAWTGEEPSSAALTLAGCAPIEAKRDRPRALDRVTRHLAFANEMKLAGTPSCLLVERDGTARLLASWGLVPDRIRAGS